MAFLIDIEKNIKIHMENKRSRLAKEILRKKKMAESNRLPDFKIYCKATITKSTPYLPKNKHISRWNRIQSPKINSCIYSQLIFDKSARNYKTPRGNIGKTLSDINHSIILYDPPPRVLEIKAKITNGT